MGANKILILLLLILLLYANARTIRSQNIEYVGSTLWSQANDVKVVGDYAFCAYDKGLAIVDMSDRANPEYVSQSYLGGHGRAIDVVGEYAYIADSERGLAAIDISDLSNPVLIGSLDTPGYALDISVYGAYAFLADGGAGLQIVDISDASNMSIAGSCDSIGWATGVFVTGNYAFITAGLSGGNSALHILDISDPENPMVVGSCSFPVPSEVMDVEVSGNYAFVAANSLQIFDISDPAHPIIVVPNSQAGNASDISISGHYAYLHYTFTWGNGPDERPGCQGFYNIVDISDPLNAVSIAHGFLPGSIAFGLCISGDYAYFAEDAGIQILNIVDPANPIFAGSYDSPKTVYDACIDGNYAYLVDNDRLWIADISDPVNPVFISRCNSVKGYILTVFGDYAYAASWYEAFYPPGALYLTVDIVDISNPFDPMSVGHYETAESSEGIFVSGDYLYLAAGFHHFEIVDITDPSDPEHAGNFGELHSANGIYVSANYAFIAGATSDLVILDVSDPTNPTLVANLETPGLAKDIFVSGNYAYLIWVDPGNNWLNGMEIIDVSQPTAPSQAGSLEIGPDRNITDIFESEGFAYITWYNYDEANDFTVVDINDPENPSLVDNFDIGNAPQSIFINGDLLYVGDNALQILRFDPETGISDFGDSPYEYSLNQNYPNPFNGVTAIEYNLPVAAFVTIEIYDILGRRVETLTQGRQDAGPHQAVWDAASMSSGVYFYSIRTAGYSVMKRMTLIK